MLDVRGAPDVGDSAQGAKTKSSRARRARRNPIEESRSRSQGLRIDRVLTRDNVSPFDEVEWERRKASICDGKGGVVFEQDNVEVPESWSMLATNVVSSKYFYGGLGTEQREVSARQIIHRVSRTLADWGLSGGYFASAEDADVFCDEIASVCLNQCGSFNSPVWFNVGLFQVYGHRSDSRTSYCWDDERQSIGKAENTYKSPQASACFIQSVDDTMEDIMRLASSEAMLFKHGSGTGTDLSTLRSTREKLSGGGTPSGPLSFMRVFDQVAAVIKSGGKTRRAAKMQSLKVHHPDIMEFIDAKKHEEMKAWALMEQGYDGSFGGEAYESVMYQNANTSVRVTDDFMQAVEADGDWTTRAVLTGDPMETRKARDIMSHIADATHVCGDPGLQYDSTINAWHTCLNSGRINASNPCSEFMFLDNSACNLASINLMKFVNEEGEFDVSRFLHVVRLFIVAQEIIVDGASYPSVEIAEKSHQYRPLGLGYANLGALIMRLGLPYDSDEGRAFASVVTAMMSGQAYLTSAELAGVKGTFDGYEENRDCMLKVMRMHREALSDIDESVAPEKMYRAAETLWEEVVEEGKRAGFRNSQVTLLAPTGTIGFMMDCDTTGIEPDIALVKYKQLAGGGMMKIVNHTLRPALARLGYTAQEMDAIMRHVDEQETIEGAPFLKNEHLHVFDCAFKPRNGKRYIPYMAHLKMMAAVQPFLSGAISKTVNVPHETTAGEIMQAYLEGWQLGLKAVAIYRDGSKRTQPLSTSQETGQTREQGLEDATKEQLAVARRSPFRRKMPATRQSITHKFEIAGHEGYLTVGIYEDGAPGELFITMAKEGSTVGGTMDAFGTAISLCLQYGVGVEELCKKFAHSRFEPSGFTKNPDIPIAKSIVDYIFRWLAATFPNGQVEFEPTGGSAMRPEAQPKAAPAVVPAMAPIREVAAVQTQARETTSEGPAESIDKQFLHFMEDAPACDTCGAITVRNGACYRCYNCGNSMGCS